MASIRPELVQAAVRIRNHSGSGWGTGFGYARPDEYNATNPRVHRAKDHEPWRLWFVTCAHVIDAIEASQAEISQHVYVELNEAATEGGITSIGSPIGHFWTRPRDWIARRSKFGSIAGPQGYSPDDAAVDVAVTTAPTHDEKWDDLDWWGFPPRVHLTKALMNADNPHDRPLSEGDEVFIVGFPVGFYKDEKNWPIVRQGVLAQIQP